MERRMERRCAGSKELGTGTTVMTLMKGFGER